MTIKINKLLQFHSTNRWRSSEAEASSTLLWTERKSELEGWKHSDYLVHGDFVDHFSSAPISALILGLGLDKLLFWEKLPQCIITTSLKSLELWQVWN